MAKVGCDTVMTYLGVEDIAALNSMSCSGDLTLTRTEQSVDCLWFKLNALIGNKRKRSAQTLE